MIKYLLFFILISQSCFAAIYKQVDQGNITYSDVPMLNSELLSMPESKPVTPTTPEQSQNTQKNSEEKSVDSADVTTHKAYTHFAITNPKNEDTLQNQRNISVEVTSTPDLQPGDLVQLFLDGSPYGNAMASTSLMLQNVERGKHTVSAAILNSQQQVISQSGSITIYVHYASTGAQNVNPVPKPSPYP